MYFLITLLQVWWVSSRSYHLQITSTSFLSFFNINRKRKNYRLLFKVFLPCAFFASLSSFVSHFSLSIFKLILQSDQWVQMCYSTLYILPCISIQMIYVADKKMQFFFTDESAFNLVKRIRRVIEKKCTWWKPDASFKCAIFIKPERVKEIEYRNDSKQKKHHCFIIRRLKTNVWMVITFHWNENT